MESLSLAFTGGWASGVNAYLVVLVLGITDRVNDVAEIPDVLARWEVLAAAGFMFAIEFVADKVPYIDSTWDPVLGVVGGGTALLSHLVKAGGRLAINSSPEPVSNTVASVTEDVTVLGVVWLAIEHPQAAAAIAALLLTGGLVMLVVVARLVRRGWRRWKGRDPVRSAT